jgi:hypothetical protein
VFIYAFTGSRAPLAVIALKAMANMVLVNGISFPICIMYIRKEQVDGKLSERCRKDDTKCLDMGSG